MLYQDHIQKAYFKDIYKYTLLSKEEELAYLIKAKEGDTNALHKLVCCNQRFVIRVANIYQSQGLDFLELVNEGNWGLIHAVSKYDLNSKTRFLSYAVWWIRQAIIKSLYEQVRVIKLPFNRSALLFKYRRLSPHNLSTRSLLTKLKITEEELSELKALDEDLLSMEASLSDHERGFVKDTLIDADANPEKDVAKTYLSDYIKGVLSKMNKVEVVILENYFGFNGATFDLEALANQLGLSKERVRQIKDRALRRAKVLMHRYQEDYND
jgi:RNA polymerase primary sigma factor